MHTAFNKYKLISILYNHAEPRNLPPLTEVDAKEIIESLEDDNGYAALNTVRGKELGFSVFSDRLFETETYERRYGPINQVISSPDLLR